MLFASSLLFALNIVIPTKMGWLNDYEDGLLSMMHDAIQEDTVSGKIDIQGCCTVGV